MIELPSMLTGIDRPTIGLVQYVAEKSVDANKYPIVRALPSIIADSSNVASTTGITAFSKFYNIKKEVFNYDGAAFRLYSSGQYKLDTGTLSVSFGFLFNGTTVSVYTTVPVLGSTTTLRPWIAWLDCVTRSVAASGVLEVGGGMTVYDSAGDSRTFLADGGAYSANTSADGTIKPYVNFVSSAASNLAKCEIFTATFSEQGFRQRQL